MKRQFCLAVLIIFSFVNIAVAADLGQLFTQVKSELLKKGVAANDVNTIQPAATNLLGLGINKESIVKIITDLIGLKVNGDLLNSPLQALGGLVQAGQKPSLASNVMSLAINQVKNLNLTGNSAVSKIVDIINQKKDEFLKVKQQVQGNVTKSLGSFFGK